MSFLVPLLCPYDCLPRLNRTAFERGKIAARQGQLAQAKEFMDRAYDSMSPGKPTHSSFMATKYHKGLIFLQNRSQEQALKYLKEALEICKVNEIQRGNQGESARVMWCISGVLKKNDESEAEKYRVEAETIWNSLQDTGDYPRGLKAEVKWDTIVGLLYR